MVIDVDTPIAKLLSERIDAGDFPSAAYLVAEKGKVVFEGALGNAVVEPELVSASCKTIYDLASLTKILCTLPLIALLIEKGELSVGTRVSDLFHEFKIHDKRDISIHQLLTHTSGLPAWKPLYLTATGPDDVLGDIARMSFDGSQQVTYSDLNFIVLGRIAERILGIPIDKAFRDLVCQPLGLRDSTFNPDSKCKFRIAASEKGNAYERRVCIEKGYFDPSLSGKAANGTFRSDVIWGEVHDGNAYFMKGVAGHAGLFSTADEVFKIANQFLPDQSRLFNSQTCEGFKNNLTPNSSEHRSFGFQLATTPESTAGPKMSAESFGHLGFTGTSLWVDPVKERVFILLTNRTHHHGLPFVVINSVRRHFHNVAIDVLDGK